MTEWNVASATEWKSSQSSYPELRLLLTPWLWPGGTWRRLCFSLWGWVSEGLWWSVRCKVLRAYIYIHTPTHSVHKPTSMAFILTTCIFCMLHQHSGTVVHVSSRSHVCSRLSPLHSLITHRCRCTFHCRKKWPLHVVVKYPIKSNCSRETVLLLVLESVYEQILFPAFILKSFCDWFSDWFPDFSDSSKNVFFFLCNCGLIILYCFTRCFYSFKQYLEPCW